MARRYGFYLLVVKTMFYSFAIRSFVSLIKVLFSQLEDRIHIFAPPCNILSMYSSIHIVSIKEMNTKERQTDRQTDTDSFFHSLSYLILIVKNNLMTHNYISHLSWRHFNIILVCIAWLFLAMTLSLRITNYITTCAQRALALIGQYPSRTEYPTLICSTIAVVIL